MEAAAERFLLDRIGNAGSKIKRRWVEEGDARGLGLLSWQASNATAAKEAGQRTAKRAAQIELAVSALKKLTPEELNALADNQELLRRHSSIAKILGTDDE